MQKHRSNTIALERLKKSLVAKKHGQVKLISNEKQNHLMEEKMSINVRESLLEILEAKEITLPAALDRAFKKFDYSDQEKAYVTNVSHQIYRYKLRFEALISLYCHKADALTQEARNILLLALCEMYCMQSIPLHASVNEATNLAKKHAKKEVALVNAVLRKTDKEFPNKELDEKKFMKELKFLYPKKTLLELQASYESLPSFVLDILRKQYGKDFCMDYLSTLNSIPHSCYRFNAQKENWEEERNTLNESSVLSKKVALTGLCTSSGHKKIRELYKDGILSYQGSSSQIAIEKIVEFFKSKKTNLKDLSIWDCCCGVGGKSLALAEQAFNIALASDTSKARIDVMIEEQKRLGLKEIKTEIGDMREIEAKDINCILLDAPCSGLGTLCANPDLRYKITKKGIKEIIELQKELLLSALSKLSKNDHICYITCSLNKKENEDLIAECIEENKAKIELSEYIYPQSCGADTLYLCILTKN